MTNKGKVYLVTGAARGIGGAIAKKLLEDGAKVVLHYNQSVGGRDALLEKYGPGRVHPVKADLEKPSQIDALWDQAASWQGSLDGLVNNAAYMPSTLPDAPLAQWRKDWASVMQVNMTAVADLCRYAILHFKETGGGSIVNISSRAAFRGDLPDSMHYAASKGAMVAFTRSIAKGYAKENILAYTVAPGWVLTGRVRPKLEAPGNEFLLDEVPMGEAAPPEEVANIVAFLLSGQARHATGTTFDINGASYFH